MLTADKLWYGLLTGMAIIMAIVVVSFIRGTADSGHLLLAIAANALVMLASAIYVRGRVLDQAAPDPASAPDPVSAPDSDDANNT